MSATPTTEIDEEVVPEQLTIDAMTALLAVADRKLAIREAGLTLDSDAGRLALDNPLADLAVLAKLAAPAVADAGQSAQDNPVADIQAATDSRVLVASGATGDVGAPDIHPKDLARQAIHDGLSRRHLSRDESVALGVAEIFKAAERGDTRVHYVGLTA